MVKGKKPVEAKIEKVIRKRFSEVFLATTYASREDRKFALFQCLEPRKIYDINELRDEYVKKYKLPISRVSINTYVNELEAEGKIVFQRTGLGGTKIVQLKPKAELVEK